MMIKRLLDSTLRNNYGSPLTTDYDSLGDYPIVRQYIKKVLNNDDTKKSFIHVKVQ